jgi:hypothetical protein
MKISFAKFVTAAILGASLLIVPAVSRAADSSTNSTTPGKISGTVTAVDTNAMTFTVDGQVYGETSSSILTRNGKPAVLADVAVGDPVQGTATTGSDGKLQAGKVKFGKGAGKSATKPAKKSSKKKKKASSAATNSVPDSAAMPDVAPTGTTPPAPTTPAAPAPDSTMPNVPVPPAPGH